MTLRICAVVVTFNRKDALLNCLRHIRRQSRPLDSIIIVDNASTDGTTEALQQAGWLDEPNSHYLRLATNTGGAGGFYRGIQAALSQSADAIWLMDDDGYPPENCLEQLLRYYQAFDFYGPLVVDETQQLSFPIRLAGELQSLQHWNEASQRATEGVLPDVLIPFNGVLLKRQLVQKIGLPRREFFIWGDDIEYRLRAQAAGARIATLSEVPFFHPYQGGVGEKMLFGRLHFNDGRSRIKIYCQSRNGFANARRYHGWINALLFVAKQLWFYSLTRPSPRNLALVLRGLFDSWRGNFTRHTHYIGR
ncbi:glycosyltransferase family 2 protein [Saccharospirillum sp. HFRX-1]|uniref:glycosyltransferase family 2 protein n=1 Tax=unclassified Saccharospirillum TaxID=2633430 RepID=UPI00372230B3